MRRGWKNRWGGLLLWVSGMAALAGGGAAWAQAAPGAAVPTTTAASPVLAADNPYGLKAVWAQGDVVARGTLVVMGLMSLGSWSIFLTRMIGSMRLAREARRARETFLEAANLPAGMATLTAGGAFHFIASAGVRAGDRHEGTLTENIDRATWVATCIQRSVDEVQSRLQEGLAFLATVGSTAPFIGLFGTVWGIYHALTEIGIAGQASIDKVAGPVGESLIMTALGLAVAVPAVLGYNWLVRRNKVMMDAVRGFATDLHGVLMGARAARH